MNPPTHNGNNGTLGKVLYILLAALFTIAMALATANMADLNRRLSVVETTFLSRGERIAALEVQYGQIQAQLDRIEKKLDDHMDRGAR